MEFIAETLKKARKAKGLSLEEVAKATNINKKYLESLEKGDYSLFPGETYAKGFLRNYGSFLGLNGEELVKRYSLKKSPPVPGPPLPKKKSKKRNLKPLYYIILSAIIILLLFLIWLSYRQYSQYLSLDRPEIPEIEVPRRPEIEAPPGLSLSLEGEGEKEEEIFGEPKVEERELILKGVVKEITWVRVIADGENVEEGILEIGEERTWKAKERIRIKIGNAEGIELFLDDKAVGVLGERGEVVTKVFTP